MDNTKQTSSHEVYPVIKPFKIYDCFTFFNEKELLNLRINILKDYVDGFILIEANHTFSGIHKSYNAINYLQELRLNSDKIRVIEVDTSDLLQEEDSWIRERRQKNALKNVIHEYDDDSVFILSDCDEIINPKYLKDYIDLIKQDIKTPCRFVTDTLSTRADLTVYHKDNGYEKLEVGIIAHKFCVQHYTHDLLRYHFVANYLYDKGEKLTTGWHFTWMGDGENRVNKLISFSHNKDYHDGSLIPDWQSEEMKTHLLNFTPKENEKEPLLRHPYKLLKYPLNKLPKEVFTIQSVKDYLLPQTTQTELTPIPIMGIPIVNGLHWLKRLIESIDYPIDEVCIINNNGRGELDYELFRLTQVKHDFIGKITICTLPSNIGCSGAWNLIIKSYIMKPYWVICNHDIAFTPGCLKEIVLKAENEDTGMVFGKNQEWSMFLIKDWVVQKCGLFDENLYPAYCEDADYSIRLKHLDIKTENISLLCLHGEDGYKNSGSQTWRVDRSLYLKIENAHDLNHDYMAKKWGDEWKEKEWDFTPYKHPFNDERIPISMTTYDLDFLRKKHLGF